MLKRLEQQKEKLYSKIMTYGIDILKLYCTFWKIKSKKIFFFMVENLHFKKLKEKIIFQKSFSKSQISRSEPYSGWIILLYIFPSIYYGM